MPRLLHLQCSITGDRSVSRQLSDEFVAAWVKSYPTTEVELLDFVVDEVPHFSPDNLLGMVLPAEQQSPAMQTAAQRADRLTTQLERADVLVIGCPMYNFTIPSTLKAWFDHVTIAGRTFQYTAPGVAKGLLFGKKVFVVEARGGDYSIPPFTSFDYQEPLLRMLLMAIGLFDVSFIRAEGMRMKEEEAPFIIKRAQEVIVQLAS